jgi:hypothetical protein
MTMNSFTTKMGKLNIQKFSDNESCPNFEDSVRGKRVYLLSSPNTAEEIIKLLTDAGYDTGWAIAGELLVLWEHEEDPPKPLKRPA